MLIYLILFVILGIIIAKFIKDQKKAFILILIIAIVSGIVYAPMWGLVSLGEMLLGYFVIVFTRD